MSERLILEKLKITERKVDKITRLIAVQTEQIKNLSNQVNTLWLKYDKEFGSDGIVAEMKNFQASCLREQIKYSIQGQWVAIGIFATIIAGVLAFSGAVQ